MLALASLLFATAIQAAPLTMTVTAEQVVVQGGNTDSTIILYAIELEPYRYATRIVESAVSLPAPSGSVTFTPASPIPFRSIWVAVDQQSGAFVLGGRSGYPIRRAAFDDSSLRPDLHGQIASLDSAQPELYTLVVRPASGAWRLFARDGGSGDADAVANGAVSLGVRQAAPIGTSSATPPDHLRMGTWW